MKRKFLLSLITTILLIPISYKVDAAIQPENEMQLRIIYDKKNKNASYFHYDLSKNEKVNAKIKLKNNKNEKIKVKYYSTNAIGNYKGPINYTINEAEYSKVLDEPYRFMNRLPISETIEIGPNKEKIIEIKLDGSKFENGQTLGSIQLEVVKEEQKSKTKIQTLYSIGVLIDKNVNKINKKEIYINETKIEDYYKKYKLKLEIVNKAALVKKDYKLDVKFYDKKGVLVNNYYTEDLNFAPNTNIVTDIIIENKKYDKIKVSLIDDKNNKNEEKEYKFDKIYINKNLSENDGQINPSNEELKDEETKKEKEKDKIIKKKEKESNNFLIIIILSIISLMLFILLLIKKEKYMAYFEESATVDLINDKLEYNLNKKEINEKDDLFEYLEELNMKKKVKIRKLKIKVIEYNEEGKIYKIKIKKC